jgi:hypothetical protein
MTDMPSKLTKQKDGTLLIKDDLLYATELSKLFGPEANGKKLYRPKPPALYSTINDHYDFLPDVDRVKAFADATSVAHSRGDTSIDLPIETKSRIGSFLDPSAFKGYGGKSYNRRRHKRNHRTRKHRQRRG